MTEHIQKRFVDKRSKEEMDNELATHILYWYDADKRKRTRCNGIAIRTDGTLLITRATCSKKDQFVKARGRLIVQKRMFGQAKKHNWMLTLDLNLIINSRDPEIVGKMVADIYSEIFPGDERGAKRAFNIGKVYARYRAYLDDTLSTMMDVYEHGHPSN